MKRFLSALLAVFMIATLICVPTFAEGEGEAAPLDETVTPTYDWYTTEAGATMYIDSASDFLGLCYLSNLSANFKVTSVTLADETVISEGVTFEGQTIKMTADICMNPNWVAKHQAGETGYCVTWDGTTVTMPTNTPDNIIDWGSPISKFYGTFDGQGYTLSGIYVNKASSWHCAGLIGALGTASSATSYTSGYLKNLIYTDSVVYGSLTTTTAGNNGFASLVGGFYAGEVDNVYVDADVVHYGGTNGRPNVGGIVGFCWNGTLTDAAFAGSVYAIESATNMTLCARPSRNSQIIANNHGSFIPTVKNCAAVGEIHSNDMDLAIKDGGANLTIENYLTTKITTLASDTVADNFKPMYNGNKDTWDTYNAETVDMVYSKVAGAVVPATVAAMLNHNAWAQVGEVEGVAALRILTGLENLDWAKVSYTVTVGEKTESTDAITTVYESVTAAGETVKASEMEDEAGNLLGYEYLYGLVIKGIPTEGEVTLTVTPTITTLKGVEVTLHSFTVKLNNGAIVK